MDPSHETTLLLPSATPRSTPLLQRHAAVYAALVRNSIARDLSFKANFAFWLLVELLWFGLQLTFNNVLYLHTDLIGTWTKWEVVMLIGASHFIQQLFQAFFLLNCAQLTDLVHTGKFDFMLLLPVNTRFLVSCKLLDLSGFVSAASGLAVVLYAGHQLGMSPSFSQIACFGLLCGAAILVHYSLMFMMAATSFWCIRAQGIIMAYYNLFSVTRIPDVAFRGAARAVFTLAIPMLLVANVPVKVLTNKLSSPWEMLLLVAVSGLFFWMSQIVWRAALRRYNSASS